MGWKEDKETGQEVHESLVSSEESEPAKVGPGGKKWRGSGGV